MESLSDFPSFDDFDPPFSFDENESDQSTSATDSYKDECVSLHTGDVQLLLKLLQEMKTVFKNWIRRNFGTSEIIRANTVKDGSSARIERMLLHSLDAEQQKLAEIQTAYDRLSQNPDDFVAYRKARSIVMLYLDEFVYYLEHMPV